MTAEEQARGALRESMRLNGDVMREGGTQMSAIDPQEFGEVRADVRTLMQNDREKTDSLRALVEAVQAIQVQLAEAKGGWKLLVGLGGAAASLSAVATWFVHEFLKR
jgi:hypothetical protein